MTRRRSRSTFRSACLALALAAAFLAAREAIAMSCCGSTLAQPDRLGPCERLSLQVGALSDVSLGYVLPNGGYLSNPASVFEGEGRLRLGVAVRLSQSWQLSAGSEWVQGLRRYGEESSTAGAFGDTTLGVRYEPRVLRDWGFTATIGLPTDRTMAEAHDRLGGDVTGVGAASLRLGAVYEYDWSANFLVAGGGVTGVGPERGTGVAPTVDADFLLALGHTFTSRMTLSASAALVYEPDLYQNGVRLPGSSWRRSTLAITAAWPLSYRTTLSGSVFANPPAALLLRNLPAQVGASLSIRWALIGH